MVIACSGFWKWERPKNVCNRILFHWPLIRASYYVVFYCAMRIDILHESNLTLQWSLFLLQVLKNNVNTKKKSSPTQLNRCCCRRHHDSRRFTTSSNDEDSNTKHEVTTITTASPLPEESSQGQDCRQRVQWRVCLDGSRDPTIQQFGSGQKHRPGLYWRRQ